MPITVADGLEIQGAFGFSDPVITYRRNLPTPIDGQEFLCSIVFGDITSNYKRNLVPTQTALEIYGVIGMATTITRSAPFRGIYAPSALIDVTIGKYLLGDTGSEIIYHIPQKLAIRPHLIAPPNGSVHRLASPIMIWTPTLGAVYYEVFIARDIDFTDIVARYDVLATEMQRGFLFGDTYYWRVRAVAPPAWSDYSEVWSFTIPAFSPDLVLDHSAAGRERLLQQFHEDA